MSKGVLLFAQNNKKINYVKQAVFCANRIKKYMNLPVAIATNDIEYAKTISNDCFDNYISLESAKYTQNKHFYNGVYNTTILPWYNKNRSNCYYLTPFDETIVMDTDFIVSNDQLNYAFKTASNLMLYRDICDVGFNRDLKEFKYITETSIPMYWATVVYFKKNQNNMGMLV